MNRVKVELLHSSPLFLADMAIAKCWNKPAKNVDHMIERMYRVGIKNRHASTLEHINYTFDIDGIPRYILQELVRHRHASYSVKSTRYTLSEIKDLPAFEGKGYSKAKNFVYMTSDIRVNNRSIAALNALQEVVKMGVSNDIAKACMPETYRTSLIMTINMRSLQNFFNLRTNKSAHPDIDHLARLMWKEIPKDHKFMFEEFIHPERIKDE